MVSDNLTKLLSSYLVHSGFTYMYHISFNTMMHSHHGLPQLQNRHLWAVSDPQVWHQPQQAPTKCVWVQNIEVVFSWLPTKPIQLFRYLGKTSHWSGSPGATDTIQWCQHLWSYVYDAVSHKWYRHSLRHKTKESNTRESVAPWVVTSSQVRYFP